MDDFDSVSWNNQESGDSQGVGEGEQDVNATAPVTLDDPSQGYLVTRVSDPQTENDGTKDAFVSYLVTTDVSGRLWNEVSMLIPTYRQTSQHSRSLMLAFGAGLQTLSSFGSHCQETSLMWRCPRCQTSTKWVYTHSLTATAALFLTVLCRVRTRR